MGNSFHRFRCRSAASASSLVPFHYYIATVPDRAHAFAKSHGVSSMLSYTSLKQAHARHDVHTAFVLCMCVRACVYTRRALPVASKACRILPPAPPPAIRFFFLHWSACRLPCLIAAAVRFFVPGVMCVLSPPPHPWCSSIAPAPEIFSALWSFGRNHSRHSPHRRHSPHSVSIKCNSTV